MKRHCLSSLSASAVVCAALSFGSVSTFAQAQPAEAAQPVQMLSPNQLDDLVAPIALYPDPLLSQILVATTYPLELVQASQWMQRNKNLTGQSLTQAAEQQNWDPSVQGLVIYPDVVNRLNQDITWTTNLGDAFLNQQSDVMDAVQRMRGSAQNSGKLQSTPQQLVTSAGAPGQSIIQIMPSDPQVIYVPTYDPSAIWGPSNYYSYPNWYYPSYYGGGSLFSFGVGIPVASYFGGGWGGWNSYGWLPGWGGRNVMVNNGFFNRYNFNLRGGPVLYGSTPWYHNGYHRLGVPYTSSALYSRYGAFARPGYPARLGYATPYRGNSYGVRTVQPYAGAGRVGNYRQVSPQRFTPNYRGNNFVASPNRGVANFQGSRGFTGGTTIRSSPAPIRSGGLSGGGGGFRSNGGGGGFHGGGGGHAGGGHGGGHR